MNQFILSLILTIQVSLAGSLHLSEGSSNAGRQFNLSAVLPCQSNYWQQFQVFNNPTPGTDHRWLVFHLNRDWAFTIPHIPKAEARKLYDGLNWMINGIRPQPSEGLSFGPTLLNQNQPRYFNLTTIAWTETGWTAARFSSVIVPCSGSSPSLVFEFSALGALANVTISHQAMMSLHRGLEFVFTE